MTERDRYLDTISFKRPEQLPWWPGTATAPAVQRWQAEGLPRHENWLEYLARESGLESPPVPPLRLPLYAGAMKGDGTRQPVPRLHSEHDWEATRELYRHDTPGRWPPDLSSRCHQALEQGAALTLRVSGPFWQMREWWGTEALCLLFVDNPQLIHEMVRFWTDFVQSLLEHMFVLGSMDTLIVAEEMAYGSHPLISCAMVELFLAPAYRTWSETARDHGCPVVELDSDGFIEDLLPVWQQCGINGVRPLQVAAHNDVLRIRRRYPRLVLTGALAGNLLREDALSLREQLKKIILPLRESGGYIAMADSPLTEEVSWQQVVHFGTALAEQCGRL